MQGVRRSSMQADRLGRGYWAMFATPLSRRQETAGHKAKGQKERQKRKEERRTEWRLKKERWKEDTGQKGKEVEVVILHKVTKGRNDRGVKLYGMMCTVESVDSCS